MQENLWGIVLAGGNGSRLWQYIYSKYGYDCPKQFCVLTGTRSMLRHTIDRIGRLVPSNRLHIVVNEQHLQFMNKELSEQSEYVIIVHPYNRDTAPAIIHPLLKISSVDLEASVAIYPSDHFILNENKFTESLSHAAKFVDDYPECIVLVGVYPDRPETSYGWIKFSNEIGRSNGEYFFQVEQFVEKPDTSKARVLFRSGCLWNTFIMVGKVNRFLTMFKIFAPELYSLFTQSDKLLDARYENEELRKIFKKIESINFSRAILQKSHANLAVLPLRGVYWNDWGDENRVKKDLSEKLKIDKMKEEIASKRRIDEWAKRCLGEDVKLRVTR
ncbi:MAG: hypothetical protein C0417_07120 [Chlorobiaceae bacterium]|nr:hypothetical protein [Chlorobiaceae bacterium]